MLSDIVNLKNQLDKLSAVPVRDLANHSLNEITYLADSLNKHQQNIRDSFDIFERELNSLKIKIKQDIEEAEKMLFQESYKSYTDVVEWELLESSDHVLKIRNSNNPNIELYRSRLKLYVNWQHSAIIIRPSSGPFIEDMVGFDPLYIVDLKHELLVPSLSKFTDQYQNRLRSYSIKENVDREILDKIPNNQFGLCLAYDYLDYRPFEMIQKYLTEVYQKLKPGGIFIMTFNDCDRASAVRLAEKNHRSYTPGSFVKNLAINVGYEIVYSHNTDEASTWLELRKPGELTSIKGGQPLAKIVSKPL
jgi:SAM-dependent methyltransferase